ncbi:B-cell receptor-associated protein 29-like [Protopterus annectens]|uniref:B-cell receptor-associated protein 29-like n=1 Tax=Protopterus annectens TaxID=7888 RepID=UPI001CFBCA46|nr:B-cell receptor-associated protein 29-like [Protopterus annectens]
MTLQWTAVASFLYTEIAVILLLCIPFISAQRWQKIFNFQFWGKIATYWNRAFLAIIVILVVLFLDAVREVRKYSAVHTVSTDSKQFPNAYDHVHMKLFRAQRNLYISGFFLFLWLSFKRLITLITQLASEGGNSDVLKCQAESSSDAAKKCMEENEALKGVPSDGGEADDNIPQPAGPSDGGEADDSIPQPAADDSIPQSAGPSDGTEADDSIPQPAGPSDGSEAVDSIPQPAGPSDGSEADNSIPQPTVECQEDVDCCLLNTMKDLNRHH